MTQAIQTRMLLALGLEVAAVAILAVVGADLAAHKRVDDLGGVNMRGYRGAVMPQRQPNEIRIAVAGGGAAFGWGVAAGETVAPVIRQLVAFEIDQPGRLLRPVTAVNLGALGLPLADYATRIERFRDLTPDVICLYVDLVDSAAGAVWPPFDSGITALTGYVPVLPIVLEEKGDLLARDGATVRAAVLRRTGGAFGAADRWLYAIGGGRSSGAPDRRAALLRAIDASLASAAGVVVVLPLPLGDLEQAEHAWMRQTVAARAGADARVRLVDLAADARLKDPSIRLDGVNFGAGGHALAAQRIAPAVLEFIAR